MLLNDISSYIKSHQIMWMEGEKERESPGGVYRIPFLVVVFVLVGGVSSFVITRNKIESMKL